MEVYATIEVDDAEAVKEVYDQGFGAVLQIGFERYPIISVDVETNLIEVGSPDQITYH